MEEIGRDMLKDNERAHRIASEIAILEAGDEEQKKDKVELDDDTSDSDAKSLSVSE